MYLITYQIHAIIACKLSCCYMSLCILKHNLKVCTIIHYRLYGKNLWFAAISGLQLRVRNRKIIFLFLNQNIMLWVLKRTVSMRQFFRAPKTYVKTDGYENIYIFTPTNTQTYVSVSIKQLCTILVLGRTVQSVMGLATDACLTAFQGSRGQSLPSPILLLRLIMK